MRILLISLRDRRHRRYRSPLMLLLVYPALTLPTLAALVPAELSADIHIFDEMCDRRLPSGSFDVVGITIIAPESLRAYELADYYRKQGSFVVLGGYHVTFMPEEALTYADAIVTGSGVEVWPELLRTLAARNPVAQVYDGGTELSEFFPIPDRSRIKSRTYCPVDAIASQGSESMCLLLHFAHGAIWVSST